MTATLEEQNTQVTRSLFPPTPLGGVEEREVNLSELPTIICAPNPTAAMIESVRQFGILHPIILVNTDKSYRIEDGRGRVKAARSAGLTAIPARIYASADFIPGTVTMTLASNRRKNPLVELEAVEAMFESGATEADICAAVGKRPNEVRALLRLRSLSPGLRGLAESGRMPLQAAIEAARLPVAIQESIEAAMDEAGKSRIGVKEVREAKEALKVKAESTLPWDRLVPKEDGGPAEIDWPARLRGHIDTLTLSLPPDAPGWVRELLEEWESDLMAAHPDGEFEGDGPTTAEIVDDIIAQGKARESAASAQNDPVGEVGDPAPALTTRQRNIVTRFVNGECFFSQVSPRMTEKEMRDLGSLGFPMNSESCHGADTTAGRIYTKMAGFVERAAKYGISPKRGEGK